MVMNTSTTIARSRIPARRLISSLILIAICSILFLVLHHARQGLIHDAMISGYLLLGAIVFLTLFNLRKRLPFLPSIGSASMWMQLHIYVGLSTFLIFGCHIAWQIPDGWLEGLVALLYLVVAGSGVYGLVITRILPKRLTAVGGEVIYERIEMMRVQLAGEVKQMVLGTADATDVLARYYLRQLLPFFEGRRSLAYLAFPSGRRKRRLVQEIESLKRYLDPASRNQADVLADYVRQKDDLDYQHAIQSRLKYWLFLHVGFTYSLLIVSILHAILVHAFIGGWF